MAKPQIVLHQNYSQKNQQFTNRLIDQPSVIIFKLLGLVRHGEIQAGVLVGNQSGVQLMTPEVTFRYIAQFPGVHAHVRVTIFREHGSAILEIDYAAIAEICEPNSDGPEDLVQAFRQSLPELWRSLNAIIANAPPGSVVFVTPKMLRSQKISAARNRSEANKVEYRPAIPLPNRATHPERRSSVKRPSQIGSRKTASGHRLVNRYRGSTRKPPNTDPTE